MAPDLKNTLEAENPGSSQSVQFEEEGAGSRQSFNNYPRAGNNNDAGNASSVNMNMPPDLSKPNYSIMPKHKKVPFLYRILIKWHIAKDVRHAQRIALGMVIVLILVAAYYVQKALTPAHVVPLRFRRLK